MTTNERIAIILGTHDRWHVMKRGLYYRPDAAGYTSNPSEAWILPYAEAKRREYPHDEPVTIHRAELPNYSDDLNLCAEMEKALTDEETDAYRQELMSSMITHKDPCGFSDAISATAPQRCAAFLATKEQPQPASKE